MTTLHYEKFHHINQLHDEYVAVAKTFLESDLVKQGLLQCTPNHDHRLVVCVHKLKDGRYVKSIYARHHTVSGFVSCSCAAELPIRHVVLLDGAQEWRNHKRMWMPAGVNAKPFYGSPNTQLYVNTARRLLSATDPL